VEAAVRSEGLGKRYGSNWALRDCALEVPAGSVTALVGPNGAGKTTLLQLVVGLGVPSTGRIEVLGADPRADAASVLPRIGFVAQEHPLYGGFTVAETLKLGRKLNPTWDDDYARARIEALDLPPRRKVGKLSGGQQAQVALTLALAKRPELLVLDEPVASLDPLARREFLQTLMAAVSESGLTVILSSHIVADLERVCDYLVILAHARTQLAGPIDGIISGHRLLTGPRSDAASVTRLHDVVSERHTERQSSLLVRANGHVYDSSWELHDVELEEIVLAYLARDRSHELQIATSA
jgi:ABC-2 type transport system ATP-binding protein